MNKEGSSLGTEARTRKQKRERKKLQFRKGIDKTGNSKQNSREGSTAAPSWRRRQRRQLLPKEEKAKKEDGALKKRA